MLYYSDDAVKIYNDDFRDVLPSIAAGSIGLILADPPYGVGETAKAAKGDRSKKAKSMLWTGADYDAERWTRDQLDALRAAGPCVIWGGNHYTDILPVSACWLVWDKENGANDFADVEMAWCSHQGAARLFRFRWAGMLQGDMAHKEPRLYPGQKPVPLMRWVLDRFSKPGDTIFDPCCGSGPVARAGKELGRLVVACDRSEMACELAAKRCRQEVLSL